MASYVEQAYDQQQKGLVDAASQALSYRQEILEENIRLTYALQVFCSYWLYICACVIELLNCVSWARFHEFLCVEWWNGCKKIICFGVCDEAL